MAGHSKWHNIKHRKAAQDAKKWKYFTMHAKLIALAAQNGWDPDMNPSLADAIAKAKADNLPNDNIERAIKKWTGEDKWAAQIMDIYYEWYAPGWIAVIARVLTDNKNRTASNIRHIFSKYGWNLWENGAVSWVFKRKGVILISLENTSSDELEEKVFETNADDFEVVENSFKIVTEVEDFAETKKFFEDAGYTLEFADLDFIPDNEVDVSDYEKALKLTKMLEAFEDDEDVDSVYTNSNIPDNIREEVEEAIEKSRFRT